MNGRFISRLNLHFNLLLMKKKKCYRTYAMMGISHEWSQQFDKKFIDSMRRELAYEIGVHLLSKGLIRFSTRKKDEYRDELWARLIFYK